VLQAEGFERYRCLRQLSISRIRTVCESPPCRHVALHVLQLLQGSSNLARDPGDGSWLNRSRLELGRVGGIIEPQSRREELWLLRTRYLLADAESAEDQVQDVVGGGRSGDFVERAQGRIKIKQEHLVWHASGHGVGRGGERG
jgi:hypothetical protein